MHPQVVAPSTNSGHGRARSLGEGSHRGADVNNPTGAFRVGPTEFMSIESPFDSSTIQFGWSLMENFEDDLPAAAVADIVAAVAEVVRSSASAKTLAAVSRTSTERILEAVLTF